MARWNGLIRAYRNFLPVTERTPVVSLCEGNTPLVDAPRLAEIIAPGVKLFLKLEGSNPTGSFKDRGMTMAMSKAVEAGARAVICASTGNTSAAAAAYGARAGLAVFVLIPAGKIALGKLAQAMLHRATVIQVDGNFDQALEIVKELSKNEPIELVNSVNPYRIEGQKTAAFEICDALGIAPDYHFLPVGNAGNITAYWKGYCEYHAIDRIETLPRMFGIQAAGAAPFLRGKPVTDPETIATAIRIGNPASWNSASRAVIHSHGHFIEASDQEILSAYQLVAGAEGIACEPSSATSLAGLRLAYQRGQVQPGSTVVCTLTGNGLKDPDTAIKVSPPPLVSASHYDSIAKLIRLRMTT